MEKEREITIAKTKYRAWNGDKERNENLKSYLRERGGPTHGNKQEVKLIGKQGAKLISNGDGWQGRVKLRFELKEKF